MEQLEERRLLDGWSITTSSGPFVLWDGERGTVTGSYTVPAEAVGPPNTQFNLTGPNWVALESVDPAAPTGTSGTFTMTFRANYGGDLNVDHNFPDPAIGGFVVQILSEAGPEDTTGVNATVLPNVPFWALPLSIPCPPTPVAPSAAHPSGMAREASSQPVRYADGVKLLYSTDLGSGGFGTPWGHTRYWTNGPGYASQNRNGNGWVISDLPYLLRANGDDVLAVVTNGVTAYYFDRVGSDYQGRFYLREQLVYDDTADEFVFTDEAGQQFRFHDFDTSLPALQRGQLKSFTDAAGNEIEVISWTTEGRPSEVQRSAPSGGSTITESLLYSYVSSGVNQGLLESVTLRRQIDSGSWSTVRKVEYTYYDGTGANGNAGDLQTAVIKDESDNILETKYYRYYQDGEPNGYRHGLKYVFEGESYDRLAAAVGDPFTADDEAVAPYADYYFEYDSYRRVAKELVQGTSCACNGGLGTYTFSYTTSGNGNDPNVWKYQTVETLPDGNQNIVYTNYAGQVLLDVFYDTGADQKWLTYYQYDSDGRVLLMAYPSAVSGYNDTYADLLHNDSGNYEFLRDNEGLIEVYAYGGSTTATESTAGDVDGYLQGSSIQRGELGTAVLQSSRQYFAREGNGTTVHPVATETVYRNTDATGAQTTSYSYTWHGTTTQIESVIVTYPVVAAAQNGPDVADQETITYDSYGRMVSRTDGDGFVTTYAYDPATGALTQMVVDFGGLNLTTAYEVDSLGRITRLTDPYGNVTYTMYKDADHEVRIYQGWDAGANAPTGPTIVVREDWGNGYIETLTMSAAPAVSGDRPTGTESIGDLQMLARSYRNLAGQVTHEDAYFNLSGLSYSTSPNLGTEGTHFYRTEYAYDHRGRLDRVEAPTGTISRTVYDGLGRVVSSWVGTDDTPEEGWWSPDNTAGTNLVMVTANVYDGGGVGDSNLTQMIEYPGGGAAERVTQYFHDWRNRLVATKGGVQGSEDDAQRPIFYTEYDNLSQAIATEQYDGDGVSMTDANADGVPDKPDGGLLRARRTAEYDDQGRVFRTQTFSVDQSNGTVSSTALTTNIWYDHRGNVIKTASPGGLVSKMQYDGAGRVTKRFATDGGGDTGWADAGNVTDDTVLNQVETIYDANGNPILVVNKDRFHDATSTGELSSSDSRISYLAAYYDAINRLTATVNVGTYGGSMYPRPSTVPTRSATELVTSYTYNAAGWVEDVIDPRGIVLRTQYDNLGRTTTTIEAYTDGIPTDNTNKTTTYTYDGSNHLLTLTVLLPDNAYQTTQFVYGVGGSTISSNDLLAETRYPNKDTGDPSAAVGDVESYAYNALGEVVTRADRNGTVHAYSYDVLGRLAADAVTQFGAGVSQAVQRIETAYDTAGRPFRFTSYDGGGGVANQVERLYNGLSQLIAEYQSHSGAVDTMTTPSVQYAYSEMAGGANHSRLLSMTYPDGRVLHFVYGSGLDDSISRLTQLADNASGAPGQVLEGYEYLGLGTVVRRYRPEPEVELTYIKQGMEDDGEAGDQYAGLDRFGRVVDQRWLRTSDDMETDRFGYGYDANSNRTYRENLIDAVFSELYAYDDLNQLSSFQRGELNGAKDAIVGTPSRSQSWAFDALGNWQTVTTDGSDQDRTHNRQNQITSIEGLTTPAYDGNGNLTTDQDGKTLTYDAWNRLVMVTDGSTTLVAHTYDALNRRVTEDRSGTVTDLYYSAAWQVLEERVAGDVSAQYVWSVVYVDAMVLRDRDTNADGVVDERLYVQQDANYNVTALLDTAGNELERYVYDSYGVPAVLTASWGAVSASAYSWVYLHQGGRYDPATGLYDFRNRFYEPELGRWTSEDPIRFLAGDGNLYRYTHNAPTNALDPTGLYRVNITFNISWPGAPVGLWLRPSFGTGGFGFAGGVSGGYFTTPVTVSVKVTNGGKPVPGSTIYGVEGSVWHLAACVERITPAPPPAPPALPAVFAPPPGLLPPIPAWWPPALTPNSIDIGVSSAEFSFFVYVAQQWI